MEEIRIPLSKKKMILLILGCFLFVGAGSYLWTVADEFTRYHPLFVKAVSVLGIVLFAYFGVHTGRKLFDNRPGLIINKDGITNNSSSFTSPLITWRNIKGFDVVMISRTELLLIFVENPDEIVDADKGLKRFLLKQNLKLYGTPVCISSGTLKCNFDELHTLLLKYAAVYLPQNSPTGK